MTIRAGVVIVTVLVLGVVLDGCKREEPQSGQPSAPDSTVLQALCPVMRWPVDESIYLDHEGRRVYFCCPQCKDQFEQDPGKYEKNLPAEARLHRPRMTAPDRVRTT